MGNKMKVAISIAVLLGLCLCALYLLNPQYTGLRTYIRGSKEFSNFAEWMMVQDREYESEQELMLRYGVYLANKAKVESYNSRNLNFTMALNQFGDLTQYEFKEKYLCNLPSYHTKKELSPYYLEDIPDEIDWTQKGIVQKVKNQKSCGSCWAFSAIASVESAYAQKTNKLLTFSEQQLVDCSRDEGNQGCSGGLMDYAFQYLKSNKIEEESAYPYKASVGTCTHQESDGIVKLTGFIDLKQNEAALKRASSERVVSVAVDATLWQFYLGGVYDLFCGSSLNHGVTLVGYGDTGTKKYWKIKNSWGTLWGEHGYIRLKRTESDQSKGFCGVASSASYPQL